jgi:molybdate transport system ATP-binding protein
VARRLNARARPRGPHLRAIELHDVSVRLGRHWALRDVSFTVRTGERWLVTGPNGSGKTMLLKLLRGEIWPTPTGRERRLYRIGRDSDSQPLAARARIAYLGPERQDKYQRHEWDLRVSEVVGTGLFDTDIPLDPLNARGRRAVAAALRNVGLAGLSERRFLGLSYGQRRRVLLARALVRRPDVLLLDEALNGLDAASRRAFLVYLNRAVGPETAWVLTTHRAGDSPRGVTHIARLDAGGIVAAGPASGRGRVRKTVVHASARRRARQCASPGPAGATAPHLVRLHEASVYRDGHAVISRLDWTLGQGEHWCVTGPNGSGKSTFLALLYGDLWPAAGGRIERPLLPRGAPIEDWKRMVGLVSPELQATYAATACTVEEIVLSGLHSSIGLNEPPTASELAGARRALSRVGLLALRKRRARELSYGQLRLALFARATVVPRRLLLLDELFDGLDRATHEKLTRLLERAVREGAHLVLATHHPEDVPARVRHRLEFGPGRSPRVTCRVDAADPEATRPGSAARHRVA